MLHVVDWAAPEAWRRLWCSGPPYLGIWCFCGVPRPPKAQTHAVTSSVDPTTPFLQAAIAPCDTLLLSIFEAPTCSFLDSFFLHDDESEALAFLPCTLSFSEAKPFLDTRARPVASYCLLHCSLLPWSPPSVDRSVSLFWQSATSYLDRCQASLRTAARSMGPLSALLRSPLIPHPKVRPTERPVSSFLFFLLCVFGALVLFPKTAHSWPHSPSP